MTTVNKGVAHPWQCDVLGHLTTRFYVALFDDASYHFLYQAFGFRGNRDEAGRHGWVDVRNELDFLAEVSAGDLLEIEARLCKIGGKSITVRYEMTNLSRDEVAARLQAVYVLFNLEQRTAVKIPDRLRTRATPHLQPGEPES